MGSLAFTPGPCSIVEMDKAEERQGSPEQRDQAGLQSDQQQDTPKCAIAPQGSP